MLVPTNDGTDEVNYSKYVKSKRTYLVDRANNIANGKNEDGSYNGAIEIPETTRIYTGEQ